MAVIRCLNGHFYNSEKYGECPHCSDGSTYMTTGAFSERNLVRNGEDILFKTISEEEARKAFREHSLRKGDNTAPGYIYLDEDDEKTVGIMGELGLEGAAAGWLVCIGGSVRGRDFTLKCGRNFLSSYPGLEGIAPDASVVFNYHNNTFVFLAGASQARLNGKEIAGTAVLKKSDIIELNDFRFVFVPFCEGDFKW